MSQFIHKFFKNASIVESKAAIWRQVKGRKRRVYMNKSGLPSPLSHSSFRQQFTEHPLHNKIKEEKMIKS